MHSVEEPVTTPGDRGGTVSVHPAYASISLNRRNGSAYLFGSDFEHQQCISLSISHASLHRNLSGDNVFDERLPMIEVLLSHDQFAKMVCSIGHMSTPCTLTHFNRETVAGLPAPVARTEQFADETRTRMEKARAEIREAVAMIHASKLSKKDKDALASKFAVAEMNIGSNLEFVAECFGEHMEEVVNAARSEVNAYVNQAMGHASAAAIENQAAPMLTLPGTPSK